MRPGLVVRPYSADMSFELAAAMPKSKSPSRQTKRFIKAFRERVALRLAEVREESRRPVSE